LKHIEMGDIFSADLVWS